MKKILLFFFVVSSSFAPGLFAQEPPLITARQLADITRTLKNIIEENRKLSERNEETDARVKDLQKQFDDAQRTSSVQGQDIEAIKGEQARLREENERFKKMIRDFKSQLEEALLPPKDSDLALTEDFSRMSVSQKAGLASQKSTDLRENAALVYDQMADEAFDAGDYQSAIDYYKKYLELYPGSLKAYQVNLRLKEAQSKLSRP